MSFPDTPLSSFLPYIVPHVPACPDPVIEFLLRQSAIDFCERTRAWRYTTSVTITNESPILVAPAYSEIHEIETATHDAMPLTPAVYIDTTPTALYGTQPSNTPKFITQINSGSVIVAPYSPGTLRLSVFLKPQTGVEMGGDAADPLADAKNVVPAFLFQHHAQTLAAGALARILLLPEQPFTEPGLAAIKRAEFDAAVDAIAARLQKGQQRAPLRTKPRWM